MKKVLLFLVMILLVLVSARSLFCVGGRKRYSRSIGRIQRTRKKRFKGGESLKAYRKKVKKGKQKKTKEKQKKRLVKEKNFDFLKREVASLRRKLKGIELLRAHEAEKSRLAKVDFKEQKEETEKRVVSKKSSKGINFSIDTSARVIEDRKNQLKGKVESILAAHIDSASLDAILDLLDQEIRLVRTILKNQSAGQVSSVRERRDKILNSATKSAVVAYQAIMNSATDDFAIDSQIKKGRSKIALGIGAKREYLKRLHSVLERYRMEFGYKQHVAAHANGTLPLNQQLAQASQMKMGTDFGINTSVDAFGTVASKSFEKFPYFCSLITRSGEYVHDLSFAKSGAKNNLNGTLKNFRNRFAKIWTDNLSGMESEQVAPLVDDVLTLVAYEIENHPEALQRKAGMGDSVDINTNIFTSGGVVPSSKKANVLFGSIRNAAALNTMGSGPWNPDLYEENLKEYAKRLRSFADKVEAVCDDCDREKYGRFGSCCVLRHSLDNLVGGIVYSAFSTQV